jgi:subtilisin family serine protease
MGTTIIMPAGNGSGTHNTCVSVDPVNHIPFFPLSPYYDERVIMVTSSGQDDKHTFLSTQSNGTVTNATHSHYADVDLCAPGYNVFVANETNCAGPNWNYAGGAHGTSFAAPIVAGVASLMYSVNDCMVPSICQDILKNTTDPILDAQNFPGGVGTGRVNAYQAVKAAQNTYSADLDLYIKDRWNDFGKEPFPYDGNQVRDESPDIWVRNQQDGLAIQEHEDPEFQGGQPVYIYVRVRNKSCVTSTGQEQVELYWTKASSATSWPQTGMDLIHG